MKQAQNGGNIVLGCQQYCWGTKLNNATPQPFLQIFSWFFSVYSDHLAPIWYRLCENRGRQGQMPLLLKKLEKKFAFPMSEYGG